MSNFYISEILPLSQNLFLEQDLDWKLKQIKSLVTRELKKQLLKKKIDWRWYNSQLASFKIDLAREIIKESQFANLEPSQVRVVVLLNFETASIPAQNAMLKLIEEPPANTLLLLPVAQIQHILPTIRSRCQLLEQSENATKTQPEVSWPQDLPAAFELVRAHKKREQAQLLIWNLLQQDLGYQEKKALNQAYFDLNHNFNVELCLEHCFLSVLAQKK